MNYDHLTESEINELKRQRKTVFKCVRKNLDLKKEAETNQNTIRYLNSIIGAQQALINQQKKLIDIYKEDNK